MHEHIDHLIGQFEQGRLSRRALVARLGGVVATLAGIAPTAAAQEPDASGGAFHAVGLNHLALNVTDVPRSRDFYVQHLGLKVARDGESSCFLNFEHGFLALFRAEQPGMDHFCFSIENYNVAEAEHTLNELGLAPRRRGNRIYFDDPDGLEVQLSSAEHRG